MKNRIVQTLLTFSIVASVLGGANTITANAAEAKVATISTIFSRPSAQATIRQVFDAKYYAETYPDVVAVFGNSENALFGHYLRCGMYEGRDASAKFNVDAYLSANADLQAIYESLGSDDGAILNLVQHYIMCGEAEGRVSTIANATAAGVTVVSATDETKVIAAPAKRASSSNASYASSGSSSSSYSSSTSSNSSSTSTNNSVSSSTSSTSTNSSESNDTPSYSAPTNDAPVINSVAEAEAAGYYSNSITQEEFGKSGNLW